METSRGPIDAAFVVGCDGAGSAVRKLLGLALRGTTCRDRFLIADVRAELPFARERRFWFDPPFNRGRQVLIHPQPDDEWRIDWQVSVSTDAELERGSGALDRRIREVIGEDVSYELRWLSSYRFHQRLVERFRVGRAFLAGDAAHLMAPFGARGLNSGVEDACNLAWKLALVIEGDAPEALLDSYDGERRGAARVNLRVTGRTASFMAPPTPLHRAFRAAVLRVSVRSRGVRAWVNDVRFAEPATYRGGRHAAAGRPAAQWPERLGAPELTAVVITREPQLVDRLEEAVSDEPVGIVASRPGDGLADALGVGEERVVLMRPDGYVAAVVRPRPADLRAAIQTARRSGIG